MTSSGSGEGQIFSWTIPVTETLQYGSSFQQYPAVAPENPDNLPVTPDGSLLLLRRTDAVAPPTNEGERLLFL